MTKKNPGSKKLRWLVSKPIAHAPHLSAASILGQNASHGVVHPKIAIKFIVSLAVVGFFFLGGMRANVAFADAPPTFTYQGRLKVANSPVNGNVSVAVQFCTQPSGGTCYPAADNTQTVAVSSGLFRAVFNLPTDANFNLATGVWYLQVYEMPSGSALGNPLSPREQFTSSPYALYATTASYATGLFSPSVASAISISSNVLMANNMSITLAGNSGAIVTPSSITAGAFFGDGSHLSNLPNAETNTFGSSKTFTSNVGVNGNLGVANNLGVGTFVPALTMDVNGPAQIGSNATKSTFSATGSLTLASNANITLNGASGFITSVSSINATSFFGDGSHLSGLSGALSGGTAGYVPLWSGATSLGLSHIWDQNSPVVGTTMTVQGNAFSVGGSTLVVVNGNVGVGTTNPTFNLDVNGVTHSQSAALAASGGALSFTATNADILFSATSGVNQIQSSGADLAIVPGGSGRVGIGTPNPATGLDVSGNAQFGSNATKSTFTSVGALLIASGSSITLSGATGYLTSASSITAASFFGDGSHLSGILSAAGFTSTTNTWSATQNFSNQVNVSSNLIVNPGSVGIGTAVPSSKLTIAVGSSPADGVQVNGQAGNATMALLGSINGVGGFLQLNDNSGAQQVLLRGSGNGFITNNNFGIGTNSPAQTLDVNGNAQFGSGLTKSTFTSTGNLQLVSGSTITSNGTLTLSTAASASSAVPNIFINSNGKVGIGTTNPTSVLTVNYSQSATSGLLVSQAGDQTFQINPAGNMIVAPNQNFLGVDAFNYGGGTTVGTGGMGFFVINAGPTNTSPLLNAEQNGASRMMVQAGGNVGIGTTAPATTLDVNGGTVFRSSTTWVGLTTTPPISASAQGGIYFDSSSSTGIFKVSEGGSAWKPLIAHGQQYFIASGTFGVPSFVNTVFISMCGGGGAGGGGVAAAAGSGGGAGACVVNFPVSVTGGNTVTVTVGTGGNAGNAAGCAGNANSGASSTFSSLTLAGGSGGQCGGGVGGGGGSAMTTGGFTGQSGGTPSGSTGGNGGPSYFGAPGIGVNGGVGGNGAAHSGAGGAGGGGTPASAGGIGADGFVLVMW